MLNVILKISGILGIVLLFLLCVAVILLLLVLFYPITYRINGARTAGNLMLRVKVNWLLGLLRACFIYPDPGKLVVKLLWFTVYDSTTEKEKVKPDAEGRSTVAAPNEAGVAKETEAAKGADTAQEKQENTAVPREDKGMGKESEPSPAPKQQKRSNTGCFCEKYDKIKYTFIKIYDKIKHIWKNFAFYRELWKDEQTQLLLRHGWFRLKKILKNIRPRKLQTDIVFGTGSPDTTGYVMAVYGMLSPALGKDVNVTPDFEQSILEGDFLTAGHITIFQLVFHSLMVVFDKRLVLLKRRLDNHGKQQT